MYEAFLRSCLRLQYEPNHPVTAPAATAELAREIDAERIGPLLQRIPAARALLPELADEWVESARITTVRNLLLLHESGIAVQALAAQAVPVIVLKGAALIETVYRKISLRPMGDVDLLVPRDQLAATRQILESLGYTLERIETEAGAVEEYENELTFLRRGPIDIWLDVHWSLFDSTYYQDHMAMQWFWDTARPATIGRVAARVLGPEALLIHLCGHLALHHMATGLLWWHDILEVLRVYEGEIDWSLLLARSREYELLLSVGAVLSGAASEWGAPVPGAVLRALSEQPHSPNEARVFDDLTAPQRTSRQRFLADLSGMSTWRQRLRFARTSLFPSAAYMRRRYGITNPLVLPFYYPYRWLRGVFGLG